MKITIERNEKEHQGANVTIDTKGLIYPYAIREALELAMEIDGYTKQGIAEVFGRMPDAKCNPSEEKSIEDTPFVSYYGYYKVGDGVVVVVDGEERKGTILLERVVEGVKIYDIKGKDFIGCYREEEIL
jgi:hypothetical protein